jgi:hypothetical protein
MEPIEYLALFVIMWIAIRVLRPQYKIDDDERHFIEFVIEQHSDVYYCWVLEDNKVYRFFGQDKDKENLKELVVDKARKMYSSNTIVVVRKD